MGPPQAALSSATSDAVPAAIDGLDDLLIGETKELEAISLTPAATPASSSEAAAPTPRLYGGSLFDHVSALYDTYGSKNTSELTQIRDRAVINLSKYQQARARE